MLILSFTVLAVSGLPQKYPDTGWGSTLIALMGGIESTRIIHHTAAIVLMVETVFHFLDVFYKVWVKRTPMTIMPGWQDVKDAWQAFMYNWGFADEPPKMGRYTFAEKAEYWALIWGTVIMIITGLMLWNPIATAVLLPGQLIPAAKAAHGGEALLAVLSILTWHVYHVHIKHFNK
ncbi:MAG: cytochrome C, partial [Chloroflexi bacterium]